MNQGWESIHRINKLSTLKPSLAAAVRVLIEVQYKSRSFNLDVFQFCPNYQQPFKTHWSITSGSFIELQNCLTACKISRNDLSYPLFTELEKCVNCTIIDFKSIQCGKQKETIQKDKSKPVLQRNQKKGYNNCLSQLPNVTKFSEIICPTP